MELNAASRLAVAVVECAVQDAKAVRQSNRPKAVAWLASSAAAPWFDILDINQQYFLENSKWAQWARQTLNTNPEAPDYALIHATLCSLGDRAEAHLA